MEILYFRAAEQRVSYNPIGRAVPYMTLYYVASGQDDPNRAL